MGKLSPNTSTILLLKSTLIIGSTQCVSIDIYTDTIYIIYIYFYTLCFIEVCMKAWNFNWVLTKILIISHYIIRTLGPWQCGQWLAAASGNG